MSRGRIRSGFRIDDSPRRLGRSEDATVDARRSACGIDQIVAVVRKKLRRPMVARFCSRLRNGMRLATLGGDAEQPTARAPIEQDCAVAVPRAAQRAAGREGSYDATL